MSVWSYTSISRTRPKILAYTCILLVIIILTLHPSSTWVKICPTCLEWLVIPIRCKVSIGSQQRYASIAVGTSPPYSLWLYLPPRRDGAVGIATRYGLGGPGIESWWGGEIFRARPHRPWGPPSLLHNGYRVIPRDRAAGAWRWPPIPT